MSTTKHSHPRRIALAPEVHEELQDMADEDGMTVADLIKQCVTLYRLLRHSPLGHPIVCPASGPRDVEPAQGQAS